MFHKSSEFPTTNRENVNVLEIFSDNNYDAEKENAELYALGVFLHGKRDDQKFNGRPVLYLGNKSIKEKQKKHCSRKSSGPQKKQTNEDRHIQQTPSIRSI